MSSFSTGLSALNTSQQALDLIGQNISNANTPGYHRQVARLADRSPVEIQGLSIGTGVQITNIARMRDALIEAALTQQQSDLSGTTSQLTAMQQLESSLTGDDGSIHDRLEAFFNQLEQLSAKPDDSTLRQGVLGSAAALTDQLNATASQFDGIRNGLDQQIAGIVKEINPIARQIADLNGQIQRAQASGVDPNDLLDQRDQLVNELADRVGVRVIEQDQGQTTVLLGGVALVVGTQAAQLSSTVDDQGDAAITLAGSDQPIDISGGKLGGLLNVRNQSLPDFKGQLDSIAHELIAQLDAVHSTGIGLNGPMTQAFGQRAVRSVSAPLADAGLAFPPQAGSLYVSVTNLATGERTLHQIAIDPQTQSLSDVASAISAVGNVQAIADGQTGTLKIFAASGYAFDFAGRLQPSPATSGITGTTAPTIGGAYTGAANDAFTYRFAGSGTIGVTPGLKLEVKNSAGSVVASLDVGQGYAPGSDLQVADGVTVRLAAGSANTNDTFSSQVVADADTAGILPALGINSFFTGQDATDISVRDDLLSNPVLLAASTNGDPGDGSNLRAMAAVRDEPLLGSSTQTLSQAYVAMVGDVGQQVQALDQRQTNQTALNQSLQAQQQSVSGVDPNEELVHMVQFQRMFQMASRYVSTVNEAMDDLFKIIA